MNMDYFRELLTPQTADIWERAYANPSVLSGEDRAHFLGLMAMWFHMAQGHYRQFKRGLLPKESWEPIARTLAGALRQELIQSRWETNVSYLATDFRAYVEGLSNSYADDVWVPVPASEIGKH